MLTSIWFFVNIQNNIIAINERGLIYMKENVEREIQITLLQMGVPTNLLGFLYLIYALQLTLENFEYITRLSKFLYVDVAEKYHTEPCCVEKCIRHAIDVTFSNKLNNYASAVFDNIDHPTNTQFISRMYFHLISEKGIPLQEKRLSR